eukprot:10403-Heterococcus_DN1.PRE.1
MAFTYWHRRVADNGVFTRAARVRVHASQVKQQLKQGLSTQHNDASVMAFVKAFTNRERQVLKTRQQMRTGKRRGGVDRRQGAGAVSWLKAADQLIADRIAATTLGTVDSSSAPNDVLDALIRDDTIEADEIPALVRDVLIAGSDTVAAAAAVTLMEIGRIDRTSALHEQLKLEIQGLNSELHPTYSQRSLPVLTACVREALRLHSSSPTVFRVASQQPNSFLPERHLADSTIDSSGKQIVSLATACVFRSTASQHACVPQCAGCQSSSALYAVVADKHTFSWLPFGAGPHACLGSKLGLLEITIIVATVLTAEYSVAAAAAELE